MTYSNEKPTKPGRYWTRLISPHGLVHPASVDIVHLDQWAVDNFVPQPHRQFAGPIPEPGAPDVFRALVAELADNEEIEGYMSAIEISGRSKVDGEDWMNRARAELKKTK